MGVDLLAFNHHGLLSLRSLALRTPQDSRLGDSLQYRRHQVARRPLPRVTEKERMTNRSPSRTMGVEPLTRAQCRKDEGDGVSSHSRSKNGALILYILLVSGLSFIPFLKMTRCLPFET